MLERLLRWSALIRQHLGAAGFWVDTVDPRTGRALFGTAGSQWSEVTAGRTLLRYPTRDAGACPVLVHPIHGASPPAARCVSANVHHRGVDLHQGLHWTSFLSNEGCLMLLLGVWHAGTACYPATLFTTAPLSALQDAMAAFSGSQSMTPAVDGVTLQQPPALMSISDLSCDTVVGVPVVRGLSLQIPVAGALLVEGPSASGKSTLLRLLAGLHPCRAGHFALPPPEQV